jgi:hypothetical protein
MATMRRVRRPFEDVEIPFATAQAVQINQENTISLEALGLLVNILSYPDTWKLRKTELYRRFAKNKRTSVKSAWDSLVDSEYIIEFRYRSGKSYEYVYYYREVPFSPEEKAQILTDAELEFGEIWDVDFVHPKMSTPKSTANLKDLNTIKDKDLNNIKELNKDIDDDKRALGSAEQNEEEINTLISAFYEEVKLDLTDRSFRSVVRKVMDKYRQGKIRGSFRDYLATALINKIEELENRRIKDVAKQKLREKSSQEIHDRLQGLKVSDNIPFYNWLEED